MKITIDLGNVSALEAGQKQSLLNEIAKNDTDILSKLVQMQKSSTALSYLKDSWGLVKQMLNIK